jgi:hypothetical protein
LITAAGDTAVGFEAGREDEISKRSGRSAPASRLLGFFNERAELIKKLYEVGFFAGLA